MEKKLNFYFTSRKKNHQLSLNTITMVKVTSSFKMFYDETVTLSNSQIRELQVYSVKGFKKNVTKSQFQISAYSYNHLFVRSSYIQHSFRRFGIHWFMRQKFDGEYILTRDRDMVIEDWEITHRCKHMKVIRQLKGDFEFKYGKAELSELFVVKK